MSWLMRTPPSAKLTTPMAGVWSPGGSSWRVIIQLPLALRSPFPLATAGEAAATPASATAPTAPAPRSTPRRFITSSSIVTPLMLKALDQGPSVRFQSRAGNSAREENDLAYLEPAVLRLE